VLLAFCESNGGFGDLILFIVLSQFWLSLAIKGQKKESSMKKFELPKKKLSLDFSFSKREKRKTRLGKGFKV
jgi:hypothetical protein